MAGNFKEREHAFITIEKDLKSGNIPGVVLLCGSEEYLIRWYTDALIDKYVAEASRVLDLVTLGGENLTFDRIVESMETVSLMSERKIVLLPDFLPAGGKALKGFPESDVKKLEEYIAESHEGSMLLMNVLEQDNSKRKDSRLRAAVKKYGRVYDFQPLNDKQLHGFIEKRLRLSGKSYRPSIVGMIASESGYGNKAVEYSLYHLDNDLKKLIAYSGEEITATDVGAVLSVNPENNVFAMLDAISRNKKDEALRLLHNLLESDVPVFNLLRLITGQLELILSVKEMKGEGLSPAQIQKELGVHRFRVKKALSGANNYSASYLRDILSAAYDVDENIKTGLFDGSLALEYFIAKL